MSKVTGFTTIETIQILAFLTTVFPMFTIISSTTCFYPSLTIFRTLTLLFFIFRVICSSYLSLRYESFVYRLLSERSIFFKLNMISNIIKCLDVVIMGKVDIHVFPIACQRANHSLNLLFISNSCPTPFNSLIMLDMSLRCCLII